MNKLFTKIVGGIIGLTMAIGVGVAVSSNREAMPVKADEPKATVAGNFVKYESTLVEDDYVLQLTYTSSGTRNKALSNSYSVVSKKGKLLSEDVTPVSNTISSPYECIVWHISSYEKNSTTYWRLYNASVDKYVYATGVASEIELGEDGTDDKALFTMTMETVGGNKRLKMVSKYNTANSVNAVFRVNPDANAYWSCMGDTNTGYPYLFRKNTLSSIALGGTYKTSYTVGESHTFSGGNVTPTYSVSGAGSSTSSGLTFQFKRSGAAEFGDLPDSFGILDNGGTIKVIYTNSGETASATYNISVAYATITGLSLDKSTLSMAMEENHQFVATPTPTNANPSVSWDATSATLTKGTKAEGKDFEITDDGLLKVHSTKDGTITVTATSTVDGSKSASCTVTVSGTPTVSLNHLTITDVYSGQTGINALTATALNFSGDVTYSWESNNACVTVPNNNVATNTLTYVSAGTATITVTASYDSNDDGVADEEDSASCEVTVTASAVTSFSISPTSLNLFGEDEETITASVTACGIYTTAITWNSSSDSIATVNSDGKVTAVGYGTATITARASDGQTKTCSVTVVDKLNVINSTSAQTSASIDLTNKASQGSSGGSGGSVSVTENGFTLSTANGYLETNTNLRVYSGRTITIAPTTSGKTIKQIDLTMKSGYNSGLSSSYTSLNTTSWNQSTSAQVRIESVTIYYTETINISNTNFSVQKDLMDYVRTFNSTMGCDEDGATENVASKWTTISEAFTTLLGKYSDANLTHLKALVAKASSVEGGDALQDMLARYDFVVDKYKVADFLHTAADRPEVSGSSMISSIFNADNGTAILVIALSILGISTIGGYFLLRKKKQY